MPRAALAELGMRKNMNLSPRLSRSLSGGHAAVMAFFVLATCGMIALSVSPAHAFPWSTDMYEGPAVQPLEVAPRVMPAGTLPVDGIHYNVHFGQPQGMPNAQAAPPMKLEL